MKREKEKKNNKLYEHKFPIKLNCFQHLLSIYLIFVSVACSKKFNQCSCLQTNFILSFI